MLSYLRDRFPDLTRRFWDLMGAHAAMVDDPDLHDLLCRCTPTQQGAHHG